MQMFNEKKKTEQRTKLTNNILPDLTFIFFMQIICKSVAENFRKTKMITFHDEKNICTTKTITGSMARG